jgi:hypothetical protein
MLVLDFNDDLGATLAAALQGGDVPELLKTAAWQEPYEALDRDFALILVDDEREHRKYACHDAGNTSVSMFYLANTHARLSPTAAKVAAANLSRIGTEQGLPIPVSVQKLASGAHDAREQIDERRVHYRPVLQQKAAAAPTGFDRLKAVEQQWPDLEPHEKRAAAVSLKAESQSIPLDIPDSIYAYSGEQLNPKFAEHMKQRQRWAPNEEIGGEYLRLSKVANVLGTQSTLETLYDLDKEAGLFWSSGNRYGEKLADPFLAVFGTTKEAMWSWNHGGDMVNQAQLIHFASKPESSHVFKQTFSEDLWTRFMRSPVGVFKTMPLEQQILASRMARQV